MLASVLLLYLALEVILKMYIWVMFAALNHDPRSRSPGGTGPHTLLSHSNHISGSKLPEHSAHIYSATAPVPRAGWGGADLLSSPPSPSLGDPSCLGCQINIIYDQYSSEHVLTINNSMMRIMMCCTFTSWAFDLPKQQTYWLSQTWSCWLKKMFGLFNWKNGCNNILWTTVS